MLVPLPQPFSTDVAISSQFYLFLSNSTSYSSSILVAKVSSTKVNLILSLLAHNFLMEPSCYKHMDHIFAHFSSMLLCPGNIYSFPRLMNLYSVDISKVMKYLTNRYISFHFYIFYSNYTSLYIYFYLENSYVLLKTMLLWGNLTSTIYLVKSLFYLPSVYYSRVMY